MSGMHIKGEKIKVAVKCSRLSHVILSGGKNENGCDMYKNEKCTCKVCKITLFKYADFLTFLSLDV